MHRNFYNYDVAEGKSAEAEKWLKERASRLKGSPGFLGCSIMKHAGHGDEAGHDDYAFMHDWRSGEDLQAFMKKNATTSREFFAPPKLKGSVSHAHSHEDAHEHPHEHEAAETEGGAIRVEFRGHYEVIFQLP
ncbi:MAG: antibiotic biosynthesis monooxygenase [Chloroflexi bacterium]|nr:antibiotic biosynthesis monooxygenase [Chloroflexota bacterium]